MEISVIVPIFNVEKVLKSTLDSINAQTFNDYEVILVNDGSTDESGEICDSYASINRQFKVIHQSNKGVSSARNAGMKIARGKYLCFIDADDLIEERMFERLHNAAVSEKADIVTCDLKCNNDLIECNLDERLYEKDELFNIILPRFSQGNAIAIFCPVNKLYSRKLLLENSIHWNESLTFQEDLMFTVTTFACAQSLVYVSGAYYHYIQQPGGLCSSYRENAGLKFIYARKEFERLINEYHMVNIDYSTFNSQFLYNIGYFIYRTNLYIKDKGKKTKLISEVITDKLTLKTCRELSDTGQSFDRRIAKAISKGHFKTAVLLIKFVYSGHAEKLQQLISKIRRK